MKERPPVVILDLFYTSLSVARSLGRKGIPIFGIDQDKSKVGAKSRYVTYLQAPHEGESLLEFLTEFANNRQSKVVLFPLSDKYLSFVSQYRKDLKNHFYFPYPKHFPLSDLVSKRKSIGIYEELNIPTPKSAILHKDFFNETSLSEFTFPIILKPDFHDSWLTNHDVVELIGPGKKVIIAKDMSDLKTRYKHLIKYDMIIAQEYIPGSTENLYYYVGYRDNKGEIAVSFVGKKLRTMPDCLGTETLIESFKCEELCRLGEKILSKLNYTGPAGIDFKFDDRDGSFKVIEINFRLGISDGLLMACGVDLPYIYYQDAQGIDTLPHINYKKGVLWYWFESDLDWYREYRQELNVSFLSWVKHWFTKKHSYAAFSMNDPGPFLFTLMGLLKRFKKRYFR